MFNFLKKEVTKIKAINDQDLIPYFKSLGIYEDFESGKFKCKFCGVKINLDTFQALIPQEGKIDFICKNMKCLSQLYHD